MREELLSVGFADLTHFARLAEAVETRQVVAILDSLLVAAGDRIVAHGGEIRKYIGDAILFTVPDPREAAAAAGEIAAIPPVAVGELSLRFWVGVATGTVTFAEIGHPTHRVEDIIGRTVNRAAKLLRRASDSPEGVVLCDETLAAASTMARRDRDL